MNIFVTYFLLICGLTFFKHETSYITAHVAPFIYPWFYVIPILMYHAQFKTKYIAFHCAMIAVMVYYIVFGRHVIINEISTALLYCMYHIVRYNIMFEYVLMQLPTISDAKAKLPYVALVSNLGNVIELRGFEILQKFDFSYSIYVAFICIILSLANFPYLSINHNSKDPLYSNQVRSRRIFTQSSSFFISSYISNKLVTQLTTKHIDTASIYDIIPVATAFILVIINKHMFTYLQHNYYIYIFPSVLLLCNICILVSLDDNDYISKTLYILIESIQYMLFDPIRMLLYVTHMQHIVQTYICWDTIFNMTQLYLTLYTSYNVYSISSLIFALVYIIHFSKKYFRKDEACMECIELIHI